MRIIVAIYIVRGAKIAIVFKTIHLDTMPRFLGGLYQARATTHHLRGTNKLTVPCVKTTTHSLRSFGAFGSQPSVVVARVLNKNAV